MCTQTANHCPNDRPEHRQKHPTLVSTRGDAHIASAMGVKSHHKTIHVARTGYVVSDRGFSAALSVHPDYCSLQRFRGRPNSRRVLKSRIAASDLEYARSACRGGAFRRPVRKGPTHRPIQLGLWRTELAKRKDSRMIQSRRRRLSRTFPECAASLGHSTIF